MKKGVCYGVVPEQEAQAKLALAKKAGFAGVEWVTVESEAECQEIRKMADDLEMEIPSVMDSMHWKCPQSSPDAKQRRQGLDNLEKSLQTAAILGADTVLLVPGVVTEEVSYRAAYERSLAQMEEVAKLATSYKVTVAIENVWNRFLLSPLEFRAFIEKVDCPYIQAYFDVGNILLYGFPHHWIEELGKYIKKVHIKNFQTDTRTFVPLPMGDVNWPKVMQALRQVGYDDYLIAEETAYRVNRRQQMFDLSTHMDWILSQ